MPITRTTKTVPGFDCRTECKHEPKGDHGIHCDEWFFSVSDGDVALTFSVLSGRYPDTVDTSAMPASVREPMALALALHVSWPVKNDRGSECSLLAGGRCWIPSIWYLDAHTFFKGHAAPTGLEQPESFWQALEAKHAELAAAARAGRRVH